MGLGRGAPARDRNPRQQVTAMRDGQSKGGAPARDRNPRQRVTAMRDGLGKYVCSVHQHKRKQHASKQYASNSYASKPDAITTGSSRLYARNLDVCTVLK
jgi:hypothetical protein